MNGRGAATEGPLPVSIVIPVLNEDERIQALLMQLRLLAPAPREIIVVDGDAGGSTIAAIADPGVITLRSAPGRGRQMNRGAALATGGVLLFLHADTRLPPDALQLIDEVMKDGRNAGGAFELGISSSRSIFRITERYVALRTRITRVPFGDQAIFIRRSVFERFGGYREIPLMEDVDLMKRLRRDGCRIHIIPHQAMTSPRRWEQEGVLYCTLRNLVLQAAYALGVPAERLARWYP